MYNVYTNKNNLYKVVLWYGSNHMWTVKAIQLYNINKIKKIN